jgi:hypothetical protein
MYGDEEVVQIFHHDSVRLGEMSGFFKLASLTESFSVTDLRERWALVFTGAAAAQTMMSPPATTIFLTTSSCPDSPTTIPHCCDSERELARKGMCVLPSSIFRLEVDNS